MTWFLDLRADDAGGNPAREVAIRRDASLLFDLAPLLEEARGRHLLFATHGFNVNRKKGIESLSAWEELLDLGDHALFIGILWPGDSRWAPVVDYPFEGNEALASARLLAPFVNEHFSAGISISFASHSLGARMVLETIRHLSLPVRRLMLMAGAIDDNCLSREYRRATAEIGDISILASRGDKVLSWAFPLGNFFSGIITRGHPYWHGALGHDGPDAPWPVNLHPGWQIPDRWEYGHGNYLGGAPAAMPPPVDVPPQNSPEPLHYPAWSAGFVSTRFR